MNFNMQEVKSILFVCLGNICRSPLAEGIAKEYIKNKNLDIEIQSAGTGSWHIGHSPDKRSIAVAEHHNLSIAHQKGRQFNTKDFDTFAVIILIKF